MKPTDDYRSAADLASYYPRPWGGIATPLAITGLPMGRPKFTVHVTRPDLDPAALPPLRRYLGWRHGMARLFVGTLAGTAAFAALNAAAKAPAFADINLPGNLVLVVAIALAVGLGTDLLIGQVLRSRCKDGLAATRTTTVAVTMGNHKSIPNLIHSPQTRAALDSVSMVHSLLNDGLVDAPEWESIHWALWEVLGMSRGSQESVGWSNLSDKCAALIAEAAKRSA